MPSSILESMPRTTTIKVDTEIRDRLVKIARARGATMGALLRTVTKRLEVEQLWIDIEKAYERLQREDPAGWQEYLDELAEWDAIGEPDETAAEEWPEYNR
jgi:predicted transcriptional regulator